MLFFFGWPNDGISPFVSFGGLCYRGAYEIFEKGSIPGASFRNQEFTGSGVHFTRSVDYTLKMLAHDAQTSGGLLMSVSPDLARPLVAELNQNPSAAIATEIGEVLEESPRRLYFE